MALAQLAAAYSGTRVLVTGHTGFKGSWLCLWLRQMGALVTGLALPPEGNTSHWALLGLDVPTIIADVRDAKRVARTVQEVRPEIVFHLAAQPLVRRSYEDPIETWSTNILGAVHLLEACRSVPEVRAVVVVTSDKCYHCREWPWAYRETDRLGGHDPYSASKAAVEVVVASYQRSFGDHPGSPLMATARAGNVLGGGDWAADRLLPDAARALRDGTPLLVRFSEAVRPWQHVLDVLQGYLLLGARLLAGERLAAEPWNFGPDASGSCSVREVLTMLQACWPQLRCLTASREQHESRTVTLDSTRARSYLGWHPQWSVARSVEMTAIWYEQLLRHQRVISAEQLNDYLENVLIEPRSDLTVLQTGKDTHARADEVHRRHTYT